jgi:hypothetical protein
LPEPDLFCGYFCHTTFLRDLSSVNHSVDT